MRARRSRVLCALGVAALGMGGLALAAAAPGPETVLPDLVADAPEDPYLQVYGSTGSQRLLLRFDGYIHNAGDGALEVVGTRAPGPVLVMTAVQRVTLAGGGTQDIPLADGPAGEPRLAFEQNESHLHWHLRAAARYSLWNDERTAEVAPAMKVGFCLEDSQEIGPGADPQTYSVAFNDFCYSDNPAYGLSNPPEGVAGLTMGVSGGWRDVYGAHLDFQWIDVSETTPGRYRLASEVDPENVLAESDEVNSRTFASTASTVPGFVAKPVAQTVAAPAGEEIALDATAFSIPILSQSRRFRVASAPEHGTLSRPGGEAFTGGLVYTPQAGYAGPDSFTYVALDANSPFPRTPPTATVSLTVGQAQPAPGVAVSGAPESLLTGTSAQLTATVSNAPAGLAWSVDGVSGGNAALGTISPTGLYRAPETVPSGGSVAVRAALVSDPAVFAQSAIRIVAAPKPVPAPDPTAPPTPQTVVPPPITPPPVTPPAIVPPSPPTVAALRKPVVARRGRDVFVRVFPNVAGRLTITAVAPRGRRVGRCVVATPAGRSVLCRIALPTNVRPKQVRIAARLGRGGATLGIVRAAVR